MRIENGRADALSHWGTGFSSRFSASWEQERITDGVKTSDPGLSESV